MRAKKRILIAGVALVAVAVVSLCLYRCWWGVYLNAYLEGSVQTSMSETFFDVALLQAMRGPMTDKRMASLKKNLEDHIRLKWRSIEDDVTSGGLQVEGLSALRDLVGEVLDEPAGDRVD